MTESFFMVWNPDRSMPRRKHPTFTAAKAEAERLAKAHPGEEFIVLQSRGAVRNTSIIYEEHLDIPF